MNKHCTSILAILFVALAAAPALAQSAKFAAAYDTDPVIVDTGIVNDEQGNRVVGAEADIATIHVAQQKDLLIGVSAQIGIYTMTLAKSRTGVASTAIAEGEVGVTVRLAPFGSDNVCTADPAYPAAAPGQVTFAARMQKLTVTADTDEAVAVQLILDTTAAHHFNFLGIDLAQGTYDVTACFDLSAFADIVGEDALAQAKVTLGKRVVAVEEVRAAKGGIIDESAE